MGATAPHKRSILTSSSGRPLENPTPVSPILVAADSPASSERISRSWTHLQQPSGPESPRCWPCCTSSIFAFSTLLYRRQQGPEGSDIFCVYSAPRDSSSDADATSSRRQFASTHGMQCFISLVKSRKAVHKYTRSSRLKAHVEKEKMV